MCVYLYNQIKTNLLCGTSSSGHTQNLTLTASGASVLTTDSVTPVVTDTSVRADLLHSLNIRADNSDQVVDNAVRRFAGCEILLSVDEPVGHLELFGAHDDGHELLDLLVGKGTGTTVDETLANTTNLGHGEHALFLSLNVGVQHTQNVLELRGHLETLLCVRVKVKKNEVRYCFEDCRHWMRALDVCLQRGAVVCGEYAQS